VDCNRNDFVGNFGCQGGNMAVAFDFIHQSQGIEPAYLYPYKAIDTNPCEYNPALAVSSIRSYELLPTGNETLMLYALNLKGPLSCAVDASSATFQNYKSGVYNDPTCSRVINHAILVCTNIVAQLVTN